MITLKQLTDRQMLTQEDDNTLIAEWFRENDMALEGIDIISKIAKNKIEGDQNMYGNLLGKLTMCDATECLIKDFGTKDGCHLERIIKNFIIYDAIGKSWKESFPTEFEWLKTYIPTQKAPKIFWKDFYDYLHENGIYFKDEVNKNE